METTCKFYQLYLAYVLISENISENIKLGIKI